ncbi:MAG TPA: thioester reductase domain-containing protein, partial [Polyangiaceae bacterium]|nr:thioester reductase domain-containing protein [Polyangiaceae bacterium]
EQLKIRGVRVEVQEVEAALLSVAGVADGAVAPFRDEYGDTQLAGYIVAAASGLAPGDVRARLSERLPRAMVPVRWHFVDRLPRTANGKLDRAAVSAVEAPNRESKETTTSALEGPTELALAQCFQRVLAVPSVEREDDFMSLGGHSLLMTSLMLELRRQFDVTLSMRDLFGATKLRELAELIDARRNECKEPGHSTAARPSGSELFARERMSFLSREAKLPRDVGPTRGARYLESRPVRTLLLTGATGFLGAHLVAELLTSTDVEVCCLVRAKHASEGGKERLAERLRHHGVWRDDPPWQEAWARRLRIVAGDIMLPRLGQRAAAYDALATQVDAIIHSAAFVNFIYPYEALRATNVEGLRELIRFAFHLRIKPFHYLSTAAIWPMGSDLRFYERDSLDHGQRLNLGYDETKWVGEKMLLHAAQRGLPVASYRPGEVGGDSRSGRWVLDHFMVALLKGGLQLGVFPAIDMRLDVAPVDYVAKAVVYLALRRGAMGRAFHLTNPERGHLRDAFAYLRRLGYEFEELPFEEMRSRLLAHPDLPRNALFPFMVVMQEMEARNLELPHYDCSDAQRELAGSGIRCPPGDEQLLATYLNHLREIAYLPPPPTRAAVLG